MIALFAQKNVGGVFLVNGNVFFLSIY